MNKCGRLVTCLFIASIFSIAPVSAQGRLDSEALKLWGGSYSTSCTSSNAPRLQVFADALTVEQATSG